jgi:hypothetical protein
VIAVAPMRAAAAPAAAGSRPAAAPSPTGPAMGAASTGGSAHPPATGWAI